MNPYKPKATFSVAFLVGLYVFGMYITQHVFGIEPYREDHYYSHDSLISPENEQSKMVIEEKPENTTERADMDSKEYQIIDTIVEADVAPAEYFEVLLREYQDNILSTLPANGSRTDIVIRYYAREIDSGKVTPLSKYGYYLHERPVASHLTSSPSNSLFYGDSVDTKDIQLIAYLLIKNGLPLKQMVPSRFHDSWKARAIEIGYEKLPTDHPQLTESDLISFQNDFFKQAN